MNAPNRPAPTLPTHRTAQAEAWEALTLIARQPARSTLRAPIETSVAPGTVHAPNAADAIPTATPSD